MTLLRADLLRDLLFLWHPTQRVLHTCMSVGMDVCGHPSIVHGGFTSGAARWGCAARAGGRAAGERRRAWPCCAAGRGACWHELAKSVLPGNLAHSMDSTTHRVQP